MTQFILQRVQTYIKNLIKNLVFLSMTVLFLSVFFFACSSESQNDQNDGKVSEITQDMTTDDCEEITYYSDLDGDGLGDPNEMRLSCEPITNYVTNADDQEPECTTNDTDICGVCGGSGRIQYFLDSDEDGLGDPNESVETCQPPDGYADNADDQEPDCATNDTDICGVCGGSGMCLCGEVQCMDGEICENEVCQPGCESLCTQNETVCSSEGTTIQICTQNDQGCWDWEDGETCSNGQVCEVTNSGAQCLLQCWLDSDEDGLGDPDDLSLTTSSECADDRVNNESDLDDQDENCGSMEDGYGVDDCGVCDMDLTNNCVCDDPNQPEVCDGLDNNCNGQIDEGMSAPLSDSQLGVCQGTLKVCDGINGWINPDYLGIDGFELLETRCDQIDNDCNGQVDESFLLEGLGRACDGDDAGTCATGTYTCTSDGTALECINERDPQPDDMESLCDGQDNDCDGEVDESFMTELADLQEGVCAGAQKICDGSNGFIEPNYMNINNYETIETLCDGIDNDCDGQTDEELTPPLANLQGGVCNGIVKICDGENGWVEPDYTMINFYEVTESSCDEVDSDCDGQTDEGLLNACGQCGNVPEEVCDTQDNDCDGQIDEGCPIQENTCIPNVIDQFNKLKHHGEVLGFHMAGGGFDPTNSNHWEGIARYNTSTGEPYLFLTQENRLVTVHMDSRNNQGLRLRSNRLPLFTNTDVTLPNNSDRITHVHSIPAGSRTGLQRIGDVLIVILDENKFILYDVRNPNSPQLLHENVFSPNGVNNASNIGIIRRDASGDHLVVVGSENKLRFFLSNGQHLGNDMLAFEYLDEWDRFIDLNPIDHLSWPHYKSLTLLKQCDGQIYLLGTYRFGNIEDYLDLYSIAINNRTVTLTKVSIKHMYCNWAYAGHPCHFNAASGAYVDPNGDLILYATEHDNDGPGRTVKMAEFRHQNVTWQGTCTTAWAELYDDHNGWDGGDRSIIYDYQDQPLGSWANLDFIDAFGDKASSLKMCAPLGCILYIYEDNTYSGDFRLEFGNGLVQNINLGSSGWGDRISSMAMVGSCQ